jgi:hypothetical protein
VTDADVKPTIPPFEATNRLLARHGLQSHSVSHVPDGWLELVDALFTDLGRMGPWRLAQVKEKFGGLRAYTRDKLTAAQQERIVQAEAASWYICDACGGPGRLRGRRSEVGDSALVMTRCDGHAEGLPPFPRERYP